MRAQQVWVAGLLSAAAVLLLLALAGSGSADRQRVELEGLRQAQGARMQQLWWGAGVTDDLNRMVRIGKRMSGSLRHQIRRGMNAQSRMVHLDQFHQNEVEQAADESNIWSKMGGNNNGGNVYCMDAEGECP
mmetsp:Transcript_6229/g.9878  ORF Transcript_6229/g.9878 Transcript_6229/m.9878 type:complete len:132 (+) Transcript_6229:144-539(+)|eukprot:CAMPEP_0184306596 /NCGR_PEP_ID=MMETSP1049-20130417/15552_1 /TAXON_ID=77928 /ORGANISM="Proteomonas sulcata, Strain CCMP704" /LENGTH=131 /DNA_ID=CAMNT_0026618895 /DNA_START=61 /DNA_END=456 /DNA_ORIENTATION=+